MKKTLLLGATLVATLCFALSPAQAEDWIKHVDNEQDPGGGWNPYGRAAGGDDAVVVPEPGTLALLGLGLASLEAARRRRKSRE